MSVYDLERIAVPAVPPGFKDDTGDHHFVPAPCQVACPVGTDAPSYIAYIWEKKPQDAFEAITATNPFSSICGRVCDAPCEPACRRESSDGAVQIRNLKRYVMDQLGPSYRPEPAIVTRDQSIGIVGSGPAGLTAAHDLCVAGFKVDVYEMTDRAGGTMIWGIPEFRLPPGIIQEDIERLEHKCPGLQVHLNTPLGEGVSLETLKSRHDAVLLAIGSWWGKPMGIGESGDKRVVDGVSFLRRVNSGERPHLPETVVVIGGGDVAMDACRVAKRLPGCKTVKVIYRRGPEDIPARKIELHHAIKEDVEFIYNTLQTGLKTTADELRLCCVRTEAGEPDEDGRRTPRVVEESEHEIECGLVIAAVGQKGECDELAAHNLMDSDRIRADFSTMGTTDPQVFAAGDGAFGGSTIVMAMHHGQRAAYYIKAYLDGITDPIPYRTPYRTRRVPVAQDLLWEKLPLEEPIFHGVGENPIKFPEIEDTYDEAAALREAARCYRCDAETGSADYSVLHREDLFSMARTNPLDVEKNYAMLQRRLQPRENPFPEGRWPSLDDIVFLPANLSRLVIDPYREACRIDISLGGETPALQLPFLVSGFDSVPAEVQQSLGRALQDTGAGYVGKSCVATDIVWIQWIDDESSIESTATGYVVPWSQAIQRFADRKPDTFTGIAVSGVEDIDDAVEFALASNIDALFLDGVGGLYDLGKELSQQPRFDLLPQTVFNLRRRRQEEQVTLIYSGGVRSGTDAAKLIAMGATAVVYGVAAAISAGGIIDNNSIKYTSDRTMDERTAGVTALLQANAGEASMMARCTGKTRLHNLEPEDLRVITLSSADMMGVPLAGTREIERSPES
jgi:NADPH-dependent glutamate synthase beta subunit-like oxidoreductase